MANTQLIVPGNAQPSQVLSGQTFSAGTNYNANGTMPNNGAVTITPSTTNQTIAAGYHNGSGVVNGDVNLVSGNIKTGISIFGIAGSVHSVKTASGSLGLTAVSTVYTVTGLSFTPTYVCIYYTDYTGRQIWVSHGSIDGQSGIALGGFNDNIWMLVQNNSGSFYNNANITMGSGQFSFTSISQWGSTTNPTVNWVAVGS